MGKEFDFDLFFIERPEPPRLGPVPFVDPGDISGGGTSAAFAETAESMETFIAEGGGVLPIVSGEHIIAGFLIFHRYTLGSPNTSFIYIAVGDGQGNGGGHGEWEGAVAIYYAGEPQVVSGSGTAAGYRFYPGFISTGVASGPQQVDAFQPENLAYSGTAYYAIKLTDAVANAEDRPNKLRGRFKGRKMYNFSGGGANLGQSYTVNHARFATDRILAYWEHKFPNNLTLAMQKLQDGVEWDFWKTWHDFNAATISWFNGATTVNIPRFECHMAFTGNVTLAAALDQICASSGAHWQYDGEQIIFLPPSERDPVVHLDESNIIAGSIRIEPRDLRDRPNVFVGEYRDTTDTFLGFAATPALRRETMIRQAGEIKAVHTLPNMNLSQAMRLMNFRANLEADNHVIVALVADASSMRASAGDFVTVSHPLGKWNYQRFLVLEAELVSAEEGPDTCEFVLQEIRAPLYSDSAHGPKQQKLSTLNPTSFTTPDPGFGGSAVTTPSNTGHASTSVDAAGTTLKSCLWTVFQSPGGTVTALKLKLSWTEDGAVDGGTNQFQIQYSTNGGGAWTDIINHSSITGPDSGSNEVALSAGQDISQVRVRDKLLAQTGSASLTASVSDIRMEVEFL